MNLTEYHNVIAKIRKKYRNTYDYA